MKKFLLIILIIFVLYIIAVFKLPTFANKIWSFLWLEKFNEFIVSFSDRFNNTVTDIPSKEEVLDTYNKTLSWANEVKKDLIRWADSTKLYIDKLRLSLSWAENKINNISNRITETKKIINTTIDNAEVIKTKIEIINSTLTNTWEVN